MSYWKRVSLNIFKVLLVDIIIDKFGRLKRYTCLRLSYSCWQSLIVDDKMLFNSISSQWIDEKIEYSKNDMKIFVFNC